MSESMTHMERFRAVMNFQPFDRLPRVEWAMWWDKTIARWEQEGLTVKGRYELCEHFGLDPYYQSWVPLRSKSFPYPKSHGAAVVTTMDEYERMKEHLYVPVEQAVADLVRWADIQKEGSAVVWLSLEGFFWYPRTLFGIEGHMYAFYDQPELMHRMNSDLTEWMVKMLQHLRKTCCPAFMTFAEDMSYNNGPMLSRGQFDEFCAPYYRQVVPLLKEMGTTVLVDTDGEMSAMVPWLMDVGVEGVLPLERQAKVDGMALRQQYPKWLMIGHYDKMVMPHGEAAMRAEFERLLPLMRTGGFIPSVDHQTPPGVSLEQYHAYLRLLKEYTQKAASR